MENKINSKYKKSYKDEYDALYEAVFGEGSNDDKKQFDSNVLCEKYTYLSRSDSEFEKKDTQTEEYEESSWSLLPDLLIENIYSYLTIQERYYSSLVCQAWYRGFDLPNSWRIFVFDDKTLTRRLFNYYSGWQYMLDHLRTQLCLRSVGRYIRTLIFKPINNFYNLYEFMNMISFYHEQECNPNCMVRGIGSHITSLQYTFPCNMASRNETRLYGTGGKLLDALKRLMGNLPSLRDLRLIDLMLDSNEALQLLDEVCYSHCLNMQKLVLINISKTQCSLLHIGVFLNLQELIISPQSLGDDVLYLLADTKLRDLRIVQNSYTPTDIIPVSWKTWKMCKQRNTGLRVHLHIQSKKDQNLVWQECAPVHTILFDSPQIMIKADIIVKTVDNYGKTLRTFGHMSLPRYYEPKSFHERIDSHLLYLSSNCSNLRTLIITERISTATVLLIAFFTKNLKVFHVRKNGVILRADWPRNSDWSKDLHTWIKITSRSYELTENEVSSILGYRWKMLSDKEFKLINPCV